MRQFKTNKNSKHEDFKELYQIFFPIILKLCEIIIEYLIFSNYLAKYINKKKLSKSDEVLIKVFCTYLEQTENLYLQKHNSFSNSSKTHKN